MKTFIKHSALFTRFVQFLVLILAWGSAFAAVKIGLQDAPPLMFAGLRTLLGGLALLIVALRWGGGASLQKNWPMFLIASLFSVILFFGLQTYSVLYLPSGLSAVLIYLQPILVGILASPFLGESLNFMKIVGLILGFLGVCLVSLEGMTGNLSFLGILCGVGAAVSWTVGTIYFKKIQDKVSFFWLTAIQFVIGGLVLTALGFISEPWSAIRWTTSFWFSLLYSSLIGISLSWILYLNFLQAGEASRISASLFAVPLISVGIGVLFLQEPVHLTLLAGAGCIALGIYLANRKSAAKQAIYHDKEPVFKA